MQHTAAHLDEDQALEMLRAADAEGGVNSPPPETPSPQPQQSLRPTPTNTKPKALGKLQQPAQTDSVVSGANDSRWKIVPYDTLPSLGKFYPEDAELMIRSASVEEIRHWSTIDESDMISINECLNFVLEKCMRFKIKGKNVVLSFRDILIADRFFLLFKVHELTFPNGENRLMKTFTCTECSPNERYSGKHQVRGSMLQRFVVPEELMSFYNATDRAFTINSPRIGFFRLFMPTVGSFDAVKSYITHLAKNGQRAEKWFVRMAPYLIEDYEIISDTGFFDRLRQEINSWSVDRNMFVIKAVDELEAARNDKLEIRCPKCGNSVEADIFSRNSFTVKNLFVVSARLADLV